MRCVVHLKQISNDDEHDEDDNDEDDGTQQHSNDVLMVDEPTDEVPEPRSTCPRPLRSPGTPSPPPPPPAAAGRRKRYHIEEKQVEEEEEEEEDGDDEEGMSESS